MSPHYSHFARRQQFESIRFSDQHLHFFIVVTVLFPLSELFDQHQMLCIHMKNLQGKKDREASNNLVRKQSLLGVTKDRKP